MAIQRRSLPGLWMALLLVISGTVGLPAQPVMAQGGCPDLIHDGGFETGTAWQLGQTPLTPEYVSYAKHGGDRSLALGITRGGSKQGYSSTKQTVTLPAGATKVTLSFWAYTMVEGLSNKDAMQLVLLNPDDSVLYRLWNSSSDNRLWNQSTFDLTRWRGRTVQIYFNVYNDGKGSTAGMFLDDVALAVCPGTSPASTASRTPTATQTPGVTPAFPTSPPPRTATPTATATPDNCVPLLLNGGFEAGVSPWVIGPSAIPAARINSPVRTGSWALRLGTRSSYANDNSGVLQVVTLPPNGPQVTLRFGVSTWSETLTGANRQEVLVFAADASLLETPWRALDNDPSWHLREFDLSRFGDQTIQLLFNVYNDGGARTAMFIDDVSLVACYGTLPLAPAASAAAVGAAAVAPWSYVPQGEAADEPLIRSQVVGPANASGFELRTTRTALSVTPAAPATARPAATLAPVITPQPTSPVKVSETATSLLQGQGTVLIGVAVILAVLMLLYLVLLRAIRGAGRP